MRGTANLSAAERLPTVVQFVDQSALMDMTPGDIVFLDDLGYLRDSFAPNFVAVLACPMCGTPTLITAPQYFGAQQIMCSARLCSGLFRITDEGQIVYLPPS